MSIVILMFAFFAGMGTATLMFVGYGTWQIKKIKKAKEGLMKQIKERAKELDAKQDTIKERLVKASELAQTQLDLRAQLEMPSNGALHAKYKNGLVHEIAEVEQQKLDVLRTILAEGYDPSIVVINDAGVREDMLLSNYVANAQALLNKHVGEPPAVVPENPLEPKRVGKFVIYKGGKDDGTSH